MINHSNTLNINININIFTVFVLAVLATRDTMQMALELTGSAEIYDSFYELLIKSKTMFIYKTIICHIMMKMTRYNL